MLAAKPWKTEAIIRLLASVFICICVGSLAASALRFFGTGAAPGVRVKFLAASAGAAAGFGGALLLLRRAWTLEGVMRRAALFLTCFYAGMILGMWAQKIAGHGEPTVGQLLIGTLSFQGASLLLIPLFLREHQVSAVQAFGFPANGLRMAGIGVVVALLFLPIGLLLWGASYEAISHNPFFKVKPEPQQVIQTLQTTSSWAARVCLGVVTIVLVPPAEELLFRGILYPAVKQAGFPRLALWGTSLIFAAMHTNLVAFVPLLTLSLVLTVLYERTANLIAPIVAHALFNGLNFVMLFASSQN